MTAAVRQIILTAPAGNTGSVYLIRNVKNQTVSKSTIGFIVAVIAPGQRAELPGMTGGASINPDDYSLDADTSGNTIAAMGYYA